MSFRKRVIPDPYTYSPLNPALAQLTAPDVAQSMNQSALTGVIDQLGALFLYSHEIFQELLLTTSSMTERISALNARIEVLHEYIPQVESYLGQSHVANLLTVPAAAFRAPPPEDYQCLSADSRPAAVVARHAETKAPPNFALLDSCFPGEPSCKRLYSYPDFFIEEWAKEMMRQTEEQRRLRRERRTQRSTGDKGAQKKVVRKIARRRDNANALGAEFAGGPARGPTTAVSRVASAPAAGVPNMTSGSDLVMTLPSAGGVSSSSSFSSAPAISPRPPPPGPPPAVDTAAASSSSGSLAVPSAATAPPVVARRDSGKSAKASSKKTKESKKKTSSAASTPPPPQPSPRPQPPLPPPVAIAPVATPVAQDTFIPPPPTQPPPPPTQTPPAPTIAVAPTPPRAPAAGVPPPPPPPPGPPPPPAPAAATPTRSALLSSIQAGTSLRKTATPGAPGGPKSNEPSVAGAGFNVAKILSRRAAMEFSDSDDSSGAEEWEDD